MAVSSYRDLEVWQRSLQLAKRAYTLTADFPKHEAYGLASQLQRAAVSIAANIAEGHARSSTKEFLRHLSISRGSLAELETLLVLTEQLNYCHSPEIQETLQHCDTISRMLSRLRSSLQQRMRRNP